MIVWTAAVKNIFCSSILFFIFFCFGSFWFCFFPAYQRAHPRPGGFDWQVYSTARPTNYVVWERGLWVYSLHRVSNCCALALHRPSFNSSAWGSTTVPDVAIRTRCGNNVYDHDDSQRPSGSTAASGARLDGNCNSGHSSLTQVPSGMNIDSLVSV